MCGRLVLLLSCLPALLSLELGGVTGPGSGSHPVHTLGAYRQLLTSRYTHPLERRFTLDTDTSQFQESSLHHIGTKLVVTLELKLENLIIVAALCRSCLFFCGLVNI